MEANTMKPDQAAPFLGTSCLQYRNQSTFVYKQMRESRRQLLRMAGKRITPDTDKWYVYGKCSKISNTLKLRTPKIIAENNFQNILKNRTLAFFGKVNF